MPILSYNLIDTDYHDDLFKLLGISVHSEAVDELTGALAMLNDPTAVAAHLEHMKNMEKEILSF